MDRFLTPLCLSPQLGYKNYRSFRMNMNKTRLLPKLLLTAALIAVMPACTPTVAQRGNMLEDYQIKTVIPGIHTRSDVLRLLGSPTTQAPFNDNLWYYIGQ